MLDKFAAVHSKPPASGAPTPVAALGSPARITRRLPSRRTLFTMEVAVNRVHLAAVPCCGRRQRLAFYEHRDRRRRGQMRCVSPGGRVAALCNCASGCYCSARGFTLGCDAASARSSRPDAFHCFAMERKRKIMNTARYVGSCHTSFCLRSSDVRFRCQAMKVSEDGRPSSREFVRLTEYGCVVLSFRLYSYVSLP